MQRTIEKTASKGFTASCFAVFITVATFAIPRPAYAQVVQFQEEFESSSSDWFTTGGAGFDRDKGLAFKGNGNAWVRATSGWNAVNILKSFGGQVRSGEQCWATAWLRVSPDVTDGYMSVRPAFAGEAPGPVISEVRLVGPTPPNNKGYQKFTIEFTHPNKNILFYVGLHGNGRDAWIQIDDVALSCDYTNP